MGQRPIESHDFIHENENMYQVSARRDKSPIGRKTRKLWSDIVSSDENP